jgi:hypothetical protein
VNEGMETCHTLRRKVMAYVAQHYNPNEPRDEEVWSQAVHEVLGGDRPEDLSPDDKRVLHEAYKEIVAVAARVAMFDEKWPVYSPEAMALMAVNLCVRGEATEPSRAEAWQAGLNVVATWLINVRGGAMDATHAFLDLEPPP